MTDIQLNELSGGVDTIQKDIGQFLGGANGWIRGNFGLYLLLGPGLGDLVAAYMGIKEASL